MDPAHQLQRLQFLDLSSASESDKVELERLLYSNADEIKLPWVIVPHVKEEPQPNNEQEQEQQQQEEQEPEEWANHHYEQEDGNMERVAAPPRGAMHPGPYPAHPMFMYTPMQAYVPTYQPHQYYPEQVDQQHRPIMRKKGDKKGDVGTERQPYPPPPPVQYIMPYQPIYPGAQPQYFQPMPLHPANFHQEIHYMHPPEQPSYSEDLTYLPSAAPHPPHPGAPVTQTHEHMCYHSDVTVKAPKRKIVESSSSVAPPEQPAGPPLAVPAPAPVPVQPQPVDTPVPDEPPKPAATMEYANATRGDVAADVSPVEHEYPVLQQQEPASPVLESSTPVAAVAVVPPPARSWANLLKNPAPAATSADIKTRPLARVPPFDPVSAPSATPVLDNTPATLQTADLHTTSSYNDDPCTVRVAESLRGYQQDHRAISYTPRGFMNKSNWCYVNAILQALIACPCFFNLLRAIPMPKPERTPIIAAMVELVQSFPPLTSAIRPKQRKDHKHGREDSSDLATGSSFEPTGVYKVLDKVRGESSQFSVEGRQEDAEEFLSCLLNGLNDEMFEVMKLVGGGETELVNGDCLVEVEPGDDWKVMGPRNKGAVTRRTQCGKTPISDMFRGQTRSRVQRQGDQHTDNVQPFFTLQLDIEKASSVKQALELLVGRDSLEGMTCSRTHQEIEAWTQTTLEDLPLILILHLKCFDYKQDGCSKITKTVEFSVDLKIEPKLMSNKNKYTGKQRAYKLVAVVYHDGKEATKGHYITDAYHVGLGCWIRYDDGIVRRVREEHVLHPVSPRVPYLLYYRRADTMSLTKPV